MAETTLAEALRSLEDSAPGVPLLALGQTVFWDEPMKAGLVLSARRLGLSRLLLAGVHDTDYFAKLPGERPRAGKFRALPHNDTTTRGLWSAAGEFSALFGSETVVTREKLQAAGLRTGWLLQERPEFLDEATEAWGWRGIVSLDEHAPITAEVPVGQVFRELKATLDWALDLTLESLQGESKRMATDLADELRTKLCEAADDPSRPLTEVYRRLLPDLYAFCSRPAGGDAFTDPDHFQTTATTELLRFNVQTAGLPRFEILDRFLRPETRAMAGRAYDAAVAGTGLYELARFGTGAIPFDLVVPGLGRGTLRVGNRGIVVQTRRPQFVSLKRPVSGVQELAEVLERRFGPDMVLVGKAVTLIGMLAREHVFVFHEGASSYVASSRKLHQTMAKEGHPLELHPILRVRYHAWDALSVGCAWLRLPEPFRGPFGTDELCAPSFASRWRVVSDEQEALLKRLGETRRPLDLIGLLEREVGGSLNCLAAEYGQLHAQMERVQRDVDELRAERVALYDRLRAAKVARGEAERAKGAHFRSRIFEQEPSAEDVAERERLSAAVREAIHEVSAVENRIHELMRAQRERVAADEVRDLHRRRRRIELEAELKRLRLIRDAVTTARGLRRANFRPSGWWFPLVCPDGLWFRQTVDRAVCYLEPLN